MGKVPREVKDRASDDMITNVTTSDLNSAMHDDVEEKLVISFWMTPCILCFKSRCVVHLGSSIKAVFARLTFFHP